MTLREVMDAAAPLWGVCPFDAVSERLIDCRAKQRLPAGAQTVLIAAFPYLLPPALYEGRNLSRYAAVTDYHAVALARLETACVNLRALYPGASFAAFADNSPIPEVGAACAAGLGRRGDNGLLITEAYGSYVFLGEIVTDLPLPGEAQPVRGCLHCGRCAAACPAQSISPQGVDRARCLSAVTQRKGALTPEEAALLRACGCAWGCDICQEVCPLNRDAAVAPLPEFLEAPCAAAAPGCDLTGRAFAWRGRAVIERNLAILREPANKTEGTEQEDGTATV